MNRQTMTVLRKIADGIIPAVLVGQGMILGIGGKLTEATYLLALGIAMRSFKSTEARE